MRGPTNEAKFEEDEKGEEAHFNPLVHSDGEQAKSIVNDAVSVARSEDMKSNFEVGKPPAGGLGFKQTLDRRVFLDYAFAFWRYCATQMICSSAVKLLIVLVFVHYEAQNDNLGTLFGVISVFSLCLVFLDLAHVFWIFRRYQFIKVYCYHDICTHVSTFSLYLGAFLAIRGTIEFKSLWAFIIPQVCAVFLVYFLNLRRSFPFLQSATAAALELAQNILILINMTIQKQVWWSIMVLIYSFYYEVWFALSLALLLCVLAIVVYFLLNVKMLVGIDWNVVVTAGVAAYHFFWNGIVNFYLFRGFMNILGHHFYITDQIGFIELRDSSLITLEFYIKFCATFNILLVLLSVFLVRRFCKTIKLDDGRIDVLIAHRGLVGLERQFTQEDELAQSRKDSMVFSIPDQFAKKEVAELTHLDPLDLKCDDCGKKDFDLFVEPCRHFKFCDDCYLTFMIENTQCIRCGGHIASQERKRTM